MSTDLQASLSCAPCGFYAFDILVSDGEDLRRLPLSMRKASLARLLARRVDGIFLSDFEQGEIGPDLFRHACLMGLEGMVSKHRESLIAAAGSGMLAAFLTLIQGVARWL